MVQWGKWSSLIDLKHKKVSNAVKITGYELNAPKAENSKSKITIFIILYWYRSIRCKKLAGGHLRNPHRGPQCSIAAVVNR